MAIKENKINMKDLCDLQNKYNLSDQTMELISRLLYANGVSTSEICSIKYNCMNDCLQIECGFKGCNILNIPMRLIEVLKERSAK